ncbi:MAG TPA: membrane protein insertion efficiency factor YidD [Candidatus Methylomirabilis sp.]|nr:membrane protein insertion efficiency factor YidD [Candidatus Methylomirabilis sp.]
MKRFKILGIILGIVVLSSPLLLLKETWSVSITVYQKFISPHKGYHCAYAAWHHDISCSEYGKREIAGEGVIKGLILLRQRFAECHSAARLICLAKQNGCSASAADSSTTEKKESCCCTCWNGCGEKVGEGGEKVNDKVCNSSCGRSCGCDDDGGCDLGQIIPPGTN